MTQNHLSSADGDALLAAASAGDRQALEELLTRHQAQVFRFGMKMCGDPEDAKDILQETLLAAARGVSEFRGASSFTTWLYSIARRFCVKKRRKAMADPTPTEAAKELPDLAPTPEEALAGKEVDLALQGAIGQLEPPYREVLVLRDVEGLTAPEVAEVLGIGVDAVKSRLHRARLALRVELTRRLGAPLDAVPSASCPDVLSMLSRRLEGEINADVCAEMERHLQGCSRCRGACESLRRTLALCRESAQAVQVPVSLQQSVRRAVKEALGQKN